MEKESKYETGGFLLEKWKSGGENKEIKGIKNNEES